mmetsp:Transcript_9362/g.57067  ORF Transcript_9362/g.57067 Transcript_9362/m.57067 type:complete len:957 (-) Transcript_9362:1886-4756(-)
MGDRVVGPPPSGMGQEELEATMQDVYEARVAHRRILDAEEGIGDAQWVEEKRRCAWRAQRALSGPARHRWKMATAACHLRTPQVRETSDSFLENYAVTMDHKQDVQTVQALAEAAEEDPRVESRVAARSETTMALTVIGRADAHIETRWDAAQALIAWTRAGLLPVATESQAEVEQLRQHPVVQRSVHTLAMGLVDSDTVAPGRGKEAQEGTAMEVIENLLERGPEGIEEKLLEELEKFMEAAERGGSSCAARIAARIAFEGEDGGRHDTNRRRVLVRMASLPAGGVEEEPPAVEALEAWTQIAEDMASALAESRDGIDAVARSTPSFSGQERLAWRMDATSFLQGLVPRLMLPRSGSSTPVEAILRLRSHARDALLATCRLVGYGVYTDAVIQCLEAGMAPTQTGYDAYMWAPWQQAEIQLFTCASVLDAWYEMEGANHDTANGRRPALLVEQALALIRYDGSMDKKTTSFAMESAALCIEKEALWILDNRGSPLDPWLNVGLEAWGMPTSSTALAGACALREICTAALSKAEAGLLGSADVEVLIQVAASMASAPLLPTVDAGADTHLASVLVSVVDVVRRYLGLQQAHATALRLAEQALQCLSETVLLCKSDAGTPIGSMCHEPSNFATRAYLRAFHLASAWEWEPSWARNDCTKSVSGLCGDAVCKIWLELSGALLGTLKPQSFLRTEPVEEAWAKAVSAALQASPGSWINLVPDVAQVAAGVFERSPGCTLSLLRALSSMGHREVLQVLYDSRTVALLHTPGQADKTPDAAVAFLSLAVDCLLEQPWADMSSWERSLGLAYKIALATVNAYHQGAARAALQFMATTLDRAARSDASSFLVPVALAHGKETVYAILHVLQGALAIPRMGKCSTCLECLALLAGRHGGTCLVDDWCLILPSTSEGPARELAGWLRAVAMEEERKQFRVLNSMHSKQLRRICRSLIEEGRRPVR